ncbi:MAG: methionyl-tRNA formyltransferase [Alphaproteobacteria bacterium]|nr:methionyl-tRNA formyltransferase [Alphaproteobacteria bacterium]
MNKLRIAFMGTPDFAVPALEALYNAGHEIVAVYCQPPKPAGRGQLVQQAPVHRAALKLGIEVHTPKTLRNEDEQNKFASMNLDVAVVAAYGLILPNAILDAPRLGCVNIHGSLLPRWRGAAPIQRAILAGDSETGITTMRMDTGLDTGDMLIKKSVPITDASTAESIHDALSEMGAALILPTIQGLAEGTLKPTPQPEAGVTYAAKLTRDDGVIDWTQSATVIERQVRALTPWPGTFFKHEEDQIKLLSAEIIKEGNGSPGTLLDDNFTIACGQDALRLITVQRSGKKASDGVSVLRGMRLKPGYKFA